MSVSVLMCILPLFSTALPSTVARDHVFLLVDPTVVSDRGDSWEVVINQPIKEPSSPLLVEDKLWDVRWDNTYPTARYDPETKKYRIWTNAFIGGGKQHPSWSVKPPIKPWPRFHTGVTYFESDDGVNRIKPTLGVVTFPWNGTHESPLKEKTNLVLMTTANTNCGVMHDLQEQNASRRYKARPPANFTICADSVSTVKC